ncbi:MAG: hypothetical protein ACTSX8_10700, partial [Alphaproteobacteria bacterium]
MQKQTKGRGRTVFRASNALPVMCGIPTGAFQIRHRRGTIRIVVAIGTGYYDVRRAMRAAAIRSAQNGNSDFNAALAAELHEQKRRDAIVAFKSVVAALKRDLVTLLVPQDPEPAKKKTSAAVADSRIEIGGLIQARQILNALRSEMQSLPLAPIHAAWDML